MLHLDHIAISASDLQSGADWVSDRLQVPLAAGGMHPHMGTHNRLLSLGATEYLEVIAIDPDAPAPAQPRWFDLDRFTGAPRITNWICRCDDLDAAIAAAPAGIGVPWDLERADLRWRMAIPLDGQLPFGGLFPALISWQGSAHPAPRLPDQDVRLEALVLHSPDADALRAALRPLIDDPRLEVMAADTARIEAQFRTPNGVLSL